MMTMIRGKAGPAPVPFLLSFGVVKKDAEILIEGMRPGEKGHGGLLPNIEHLLLH
jgi:hypothetical protein